MAIYMPGFISNKTTGVPFWFWIHRCVTCERRYAAVAKACVRSSL